MDSLRRLLKTFRVARGMKVFRGLGVDVARSEVSDTDPQLKARAQRIDRQKRKIERLQRRLERQRQHIGEKNRQIEHLQKQLAEANPQEALWEGGKDYATWEAAKYKSVEFWRRFLASGGDRWPEDYRQRLDPEHPLAKHVTEYLEHLNIPLGSGVSILDVGAGPLTKLGTRWEERTVSITAVDVLAKRYEELLAEFGITPRVRTEPGG
jgi:hypothetical protein